ncbi:MAG: HNH endonuclease [Planctomycetes bacterium]|nr:HNH endonuclease [Planctomycetota bacterium]MCB9870374.1 HNH endonuclease [Planctomycetota bacterium]
MTQASVLSQQTLVLNRAWLAISTTTVRDALGLIFSGAAKAIRPETYETHTFESWADLAVPPEEPCVRTVTLRIRVPEVIVLTRFEKMPNRTVAFSRRNLYRRDRYTCQYCGATPGGGELSIDHVVPRSRGGRSTFENCVLACTACNHRKANRTPREAGMRLRQAPRAPKWTPILQVGVARVRQSWEQFISERYWEVPLEP